MSVEHLAGRRTGRPRGQKNAPLAVRAAKWAAAHLDDPDAAPPSALAARLLALGREHPDRLAVCFAELDARGQRPEAPKQAAAAAPRNGAGGTVWNVEEGRPRRFQRLAVSAEGLLHLLRGVRPDWVANLPHDAAVVGYKVDAQRGVITLVIHSETFDPVPAGEKVPPVQLKYFGDNR